jgi:hypothetical protein
MSLFEPNIPFGISNISNKSFSKGRGEGGHIGVADTIANRTIKQPNHISAQYGTAKGRRKEESEGEGNREEERNGAR